MTIRRVPDAAREVLAARAARRGQSLQEYLLSVVVDAAERPDADEVIAAHRARLAGSGSRVTTSDILEALDADRR